jgi:hypothetical protein
MVLETVAVEKFESSLRVKILSYCANYRVWQIIRLCPESLAREEKFSDAKKRRDGYEKSLGWFACSALSTIDYVLLFQFLDYDFDQIFNHLHRRLDVKSVGGSGPH